MQATPPSHTKHLTIQVKGNIVSPELDETAEELRDRLSRLLPGAPLGILRGQGLTGLPETYTLECVGIVADDPPPDGWLYFVGPADTGEILRMTVLRARVYMAGALAFVEAVFPGPLVSLMHIERLKRLSDAQSLLRGSVVLQRWVKGRTPGSGVLSRESFTDQLDDVLVRLRKSRMKPTQEVVARELAMDRGTLRDYLSRYDIDWAACRARRGR